ETSATSMPSTSPGPVRRPAPAKKPESIASDLARAFDGEVRRIVDIKLVGWQIIGACVALIAVSVWVTAHVGDPPPPDMPTVGLRPLLPLSGGLALLAWATLERRLARTGQRWMSPVHVAIEMTMP